MASNLLTDRKVLTAKPKEAEYLLSDGDGLYLRVRPNGSRLWLFRFTSLTGKPAKKSVGTYPTTSLADARVKVAKHRKDLSKGIDPSSTPEGRPQTVQGLFDLWVKNSIATRRNAKGVAAVHSRLGRHVLPHVGKDRIDTLTKPRVLGLLDTIVAAGSGPQANAVLIDVKQMLNYAVERGWLEANPTLPIKKTSVGGKDVVRDRVLRAPEIVMVRDRFAEGIGVTLACQAAVWIAVSTLARAGEIAAVEEGEIDWEAAEWHVPAEKNKSARDHMIYLSPFSLYWFKIVRGFARPGKHLFASTKGRAHVKSTSFVHQLHVRQDPKDTRVQGAGTLALLGGRWTMHDLRRTGATIMGEIGISENVVEKCLNHAEQSKLVKVYQRQQLLPQRREAFDALGAYLTELLGDPNEWGPEALPQPGQTNVVPIRKRA